MFVVFLRFADKSRAPTLMAGHEAWIRSGFDDGVFLLVGGLRPNLGGAIFADGVSHADLEARVAADPFVAEGVVTAEITEIAPARTVDALAFLAA